MTTDDSLRLAFLEDHRRMTQGFWRLRRALETVAWDAARELAAEIDRKVGPHMEFEETIYYPMLTAILGEAAIARMCDEHDTGLSVIEDILRAGEHPPSPEEREELIDRIGQMLDHAATCGTLLSHLSTLPPEKQAEMLTELRVIRGRNRRWTDLANSTGSRLSRTASP